MMIIANWYIININIMKFHHARPLFDFHIRLFREFQKMYNTL